MEPEQKISIYQRWQNWKKQFTKMEETYETLSKKGKQPTSITVLLPTIYQYIANHPSFNDDEQSIILLGQYLAKKYPELRDQFMSQKQKEAIDQMQKTLDSFFDEAKNET